MTIKKLYQTIRSGDLRENIEQAFGQWGHIAYRRAWLIILLAVICLAITLPQIKHLKIDATMEAFFYEDDPARIFYNQFRDQFGRDDKSFIAIETDDIFTLESLNKLRAIHEALEEEVPLLYEVESLVNARQTFGDGDELVVGEFLEEWPETEEEALLLKQRALANPVYVNHLISPDGRVAALQVQNNVYAASSDDAAAIASFDEVVESEIAPDQYIAYSYLSAEQNTEIMLAIERVVSRFDSPGFRAYPAGGPYMTAWFLDTIRHGMVKHTALAVLCIAIFLFVIFRRVAMLFLPLTISILSMLYAVAVTAVLGITVSFSMQIVPSFLIAVGVGNSVHLFTIFYQALNRGESKENALSYALQHSGLAIFMTGITTAGGLLSFLSSNMKSVAEFGLMTPMGVLFALFFSLVLLPALIAVFPVKAEKKVRANDSLVRRWIISAGGYATRNPWQVLAVWSLLIVLGIAGAEKLKFSFYAYNNLPANHPILFAMKKLDAHLSGAGALELVFDTGRVDGVKDPDFLHKLNAISMLASNFEVNGYSFKKVVSIIDINKEIHQALHENNPEYYRIPDNKALIAQELLLFENSGVDDLGLIVDSEFRTTRMTLVAPIVDGVTYKPILDALMAGIEEILAGKHTVRTTGIMDLSFKIFSELYVSMSNTYVLAFLIITPMMILLIGNLKLGLISMIPNLAPIIITLGVMGQFDIFLTGATLLTGSIALGLVVDDTIHFMHNFQRYYQRSSDVELAVRQTLETTGQAIFFTTMVLTTAFMVFVFHEVLEWKYFGFVTGFCIFVALFADILLAPALVSVLYRKKKEL
jgi:hypothetical protein